MPKFRFVDLLILLIVISLGGTALIAAAVGGDSRVTRLFCASHLRMLGQATLLYCNDNKSGAFPRTVYDMQLADTEPGKAGAKQPVVWGTPYQAHPDLKNSDHADPFAAATDPAAKYRPQSNDVTAAWFLLLRTQDLIGDEFVCPAIAQTRWDWDDATHLTTALGFTNWRGNATLAAHVSYSFQNVYASTKAIQNGAKYNFTLPAEFVIMADMNPGTAGLKTLKPNAPAAEMAAANSPNHGRLGQNVLYADGHVAFQTTPFCGMKNDNIYTYGGSTGTMGVVGAPQSADDSVLLPTAVDIGLADPRGDTLPKFTLRDPADPKTVAMAGKLLGKYKLVKHPDRNVEITAGQIKAGPTSAEYHIVGSTDSYLRVVIIPPPAKKTTATTRTESSDNNPKMSDLLIDGDTITLQGEAMTRVK